MPDVNLLQNMDTFSRFFLENKSKFLAFAFSYLRDKAEAEDILMDAMITLWENRDKWQDGSNLHALLLTIIKNKALNHLAHVQVRMRAEEALNTHGERELNLRISTLEACEPDKLFDSEIQHIVQKALWKMPEQSRNIFVMSRYKDMPNRKIAEYMGLSIKSVEFHITKALKILRTELKDYLLSILL